MKLLIILDIDCITHRTLTYEKILEIVNGQPIISCPFYNGKRQNFSHQIEKNENHFYIAKINGEDFVMPEVSKKYGTFVDNQGTGDIYSSLITRQNGEGKDEALISIYRQGEMEGSFVDNGNGEQSFTSEDGSVKGIIKIDGWNGASLRVTEIDGDSPFYVGEEVEFPFTF